MTGFSTTPCPGVLRTLVFVGVLSLPALTAADTAGAEHAGTRQRSTIVVPPSSRAAYEQWGYAPAVVTADGTVYVSGVIVLLEGSGSYSDRYAAGFRSALRRLEEVLVAAGSSLDDVVKINSYHTDLARQLETAARVRGEVMAPPHPAWTAVGTPALAVPEAVTEIEVIARRADRLTES